VSRRARIVLGGGALLLLALGGCRAEDEATTPAGAVRAFARAADRRSSARDRERVIELIGPRTRARLEARARLASQQAGARHPLEWKEMLVVGMARPRYPVEQVRVLEEGPTHALVEVRGGDQREAVELVREGKLWKLELPLPPLPPPGHPEAASRPASAPAPASSGAPTP
jgi:hypothetical protein